MVLLRSLLGLLAANALFEPPHIAADNLRLGLADNSLKQWLVNARTMMVCLAYFKEVNACVFVVP